MQTYRSNVGQSMTMLYNNNNNKIEARSNEANYNLWTTIWEILVENTSHKIVNSDVEKAVFRLLLSKTSFHTRYFCE
jgi:hypothetical protein